MSFLKKCAKFCYDNPNNIQRVCMKVVIPMPFWAFENEYYKRIIKLKITRYNLESNMAVLHSNNFQRICMKLGIPSIAAVDSTSLIISFYNFNNFERILMALADPVK